jgi:hypothetical protein
MVLPISEFGEESPAVVHRMRATLGATLALHFSAKNEERGGWPASAKTGSIPGVS